MRNPFRKPALTATKIHDLYASMPSMTPQLAQAFRDAGAQPDSKVRLSALHEAAHAVVGHRLGFPIDLVQLWHTPDDPAGLTRHGPFELVTEQDRWNQFTFIAAGMAWDSLTGAKNAPAAAGDLAEFEVAYGHLVEDYGLKPRPGRQSRLLSEACGRARDLLTQSVLGERVHLVADELLAAPLLRLGRSDLAALAA